MIILCFFLVLKLWWKSKNFCFVQKGVYKGRKSSIDAGKIKELKDSGMDVTVIAKQIGIHRDSVYRVLKAG